MSSSPPTPPARVPSETVDTLEEYSPELLRAVASYAEALAAYREAEKRPSTRNEEAERCRATDRRSDSEKLPDGVPSKATITIKEINDNRYYYWQWRDGDEIRSHYKGPVDRDESE